ncbi:MAG: endonuclease III [Acidobacteriota bacterium]
MLAERGLEVTKAKMSRKGAQQNGRVRAILKMLRKHYPQSSTALEHEDPFQLLIATILSAQCTDVRVNMVTPQLFARYPTVADLAGAAQADVERLIKTTGFFRNKAKAIRGCCQAIVEKHGGRVPETMDELVQLPGVGRKTANCVLGNALGKPTGIVVDTHVHRLANRLGLSDKQDPEKVELDLMAVIPKSSWIAIGNMLIDHGRKICNARKPLCDQCPLLAHCPAGGEYMEGGRGGKHARGH